MLSPAPPRRLRLLVGGRRLRLQLPLMRVQLQPPPRPAPTTPSHLSVGSSGWPACFDVGRYMVSAECIVGACGCDWKWSGEASPTRPKKQFMRQGRSARPDQPFPSRAGRISIDRRLKSALPSHGSTGGMRWGRPDSPGKSRGRTWGSHRPHGPPRRQSQPGGRGEHTTKRPGIQSKQSARLGPLLCFFFIFLLLASSSSVLLVGSGVAWPRTPTGHLTPFGCLSALPTTT